MKSPSTTVQPLPWGWVALVLACFATYLLGLGSAYAPTNGDEMVYIHIARLTALSGHWLPLVSDLSNLRNTKPPLLFWQAILAGDWGQHWNLLALRLPSVVYTGLTTTLIALWTRRSTGSVRSACLAAALYLLFFSTFRYGRVYLTSAPETFWFALPMFWLLWQCLPASAATDAAAPAPARAWLRYSAIGMAWGLAMAYKSFALVAPAGAALWLAMLWSAPALNWRTTLRTTLALAYSALLALAIFGLWFVLDPDPASVWREFVVGENAAKMSSAQGYWHAALFGDYPLWTELLAYPINAGLLFFVVATLLLQLLPQAVRKASYARLPPAQRVLLVWLLVWLVVFSIPSQREVRYVIPAMPALAIVVAQGWDRIGRIGFWITLPILAGALVMIARVAWVMGGMGIASNTELAVTLVACGVGLAGIALGMVVKPWCRNAVLLGCLVVYASFGQMVAPLDTPAAHYSNPVRAQLQGQRVAVPNGFTGQYERYQFVLGGSALTPYDAEGRNTGALRPDLPEPERLAYLLGQFDAVVWLQGSLSQTEPSCVPQCKLLASRWHVKSRHKSGEVTLANLWYPQQWLFHQEWLVVPARP
ncbi:MAG: phospholipid carrier-dependent glycosyltransferase [Burkholderiales bacterium]|nr:phospholipid carrier-dependent glycosyltransferase [Burkholderiales bacterium]